MASTPKGSTAPTEPTGVQSLDAVLKKIDEFMDRLAPDGLIAIVPAIRDLIEVITLRGIAPLGLAAYRTTTAARSIQELNERLAEGWDMLHIDFCEEIIQRDTATRAPKKAGWQVYCVLGKPEPMVRSDRDALGISDRRATEEHATEIGGSSVDTPRQEEPSPAAAPGVEASASAPVRVPRGRVIAGRGSGAGQEGTGALAGRV